MNGTAPGTPEQTHLGTSGDIPVTGDWNNSVTPGSKLGVFRGGSTWFLDMNGNGIWDQGIDGIIPGFGAPGDVPVTGRW
jgi:hypothetical protein